MLCEEFLHLRDNIQLKIIRKYEIFFKNIEILFDVRRYVQKWVIFYKEFDELRFNFYRCFKGRNCHFICLYIDYLIFHFKNKT